MLKCQMRGKEAVLYRHRGEELPGLAQGPLGSLPVEMNGPNMGSRNFVFKRSDKDLADRDGFQYCFHRLFCLA